MGNVKLKIENMFKICVGIAALTFAFSAYAQSLESALGINIAPGEPGAYEEVVATLNSSSVNLNTARISWILNGKSAGGGLGKTQFAFKTGALNTVSRVRVAVATADGQKIERGFDIRPAEVDLIFEAFTHAPPFYKGKALPSSESRVKIAAIPHFILENGRRISSETLIYTWQLNRRVLGSLSGVGKKDIVIEAPRLSEEARVSVSVSSADETRRAYSEILIDTQPPQIVFYEKHPIEGVRYENALTPGIAVPQEEITVHAEPYFFSSEDVASRKINFAWLLSRGATETASAQNEFTLEKKSAGGNPVQLALRIENTAKLLQEAVAGILIKF